MDKQPKLGVDLDRISNLPVRIICRILSFLTFKEAVRTSILSIRWRYLYASMSTFDIDDRLMEINPNKVKHFVHFVDRLMMNYPAKPSFECLRINFCNQLVDASHVYNWICAALWRGVKELDLELRSKDFTPLPSALYTSDSLATLKLNMSQYVLKVPTKVCFPNLKTLHLKNIAFSDTISVGRLLASCIGLEELVIKECDLYNVNYVLLLQDFKSLVTLKLRFERPHYNVLKGDINLCFSNLKTLHLKGLEFSDNDSVRRLISNCIVLEDLVIKQCVMRLTELHISNPSLKRLKIFHSVILQSYSVVIDAPNLVYFKYVDFISNHGYAITSMPSLAKADISLYSMASIDEWKYVSNQFLQAIGNVKSLHLSLPQPNQILDECCREPKPLFPNLVMLEIVEGDDNYSKCWQGRWLVEFLQCAPKITSLLISLECGRVGDWSPPDEVPDCLSKLKEIKMLKFDGSSRLFDMITYFSMNAKNLEKFTICTNGLKEGEQLSIAKQLLKIPRRSLFSQVVIE